jgi:tetratricopeptide (TPR) repeat protein
MITDRLGNIVTDPSPEVLAGIDDFILGFLAYQPCAIHILASIDQHPDSCLGNAYAGFLWMFLESPEAPSRARPYLDKALAAPGTTREAANVKVLAAWVAGDIPQVLQICEQIVADHPSDLVILKIAQYHLFNLGDAAGMLRLGLAALPQMQDQPYVHGMIAFGYEQCHLMADAETSARRALEIEPTDPWAHHALAHVMLTQGRVDEGIAFLESVAPTWADLNSFMHTHNWWHLALFYISRDRTQDVLAAYDTHVWAREKTYSQDQVGAVSLLARMEFAGIDVGQRWLDVAQHVAARGADTVSPFLTLQYLYALSRAGLPEADSLMAAIRERATTPSHDQVAWAEVTLPAACGILAHTAGNHSQAIRDLGRALPRLAEIGGSHAQRDLFDQIHLASLVKAGHVATAQQVLEMRRMYDPDGIPLNRLLAQVYDAAGLPMQADQARARLNRHQPA